VGLDEKGGGLMISDKWLNMDEATRDRLRSVLRSCVARFQQWKQEDSATAEHVARAMDAALFEDNIELGMCLFLLVGVNHQGDADKAIVALLKITNPPRTAGEFSFSLN
jgi:hypothetical protein